MNLSIKEAMARSQNPAYVGRACGKANPCGPGISSADGGAAGTYTGPI